MIRKHFRFKRMVLGLAFAAVAVPTAAQAEPVAYTPVAHQPIASEISVQSPNALPGKTAAGAALTNAKHSAYPVQVTQTKTAGSDGFNWSDAGIGASVAFGATLMLLMAVVLGRRRSGSRPTGLAST